jgi:hypothetical protein
MMLDNAISIGLVKIYHKERNNKGKVIEEKRKKTALIPIE